MYGTLSDTYLALRAYTAAFEPAGVESKDYRLKRLQENLQRFKDAFLPRKIYLPLAIAERIDAIYREIFIVTNEFLFSVHAPPAGAHKIDKWFEVGKKVDGPITLALLELETELRRLMGDGTDDLPKEEKA